MFWARFVEDKGYKDGLFRLPLDVGYAYMEWMNYVFMFLNKLRKHPFLFNFFSFNLSSLLIKILNLILFIFLVRYLTPSDYGIYTLVWAHITLLSPLMDFGTTSYGIIHLTPEKKEEFFPVFSLRFTLSIIVFLLTLISGVLIFYGKGQIPGFIILISFVIFSNMISGSYLIWTAVIQKAYRSSLVSMVFNSILTIVLVYVLIRFKSLSTVFYSIFILYAVYTITTFFLLAKQVGGRLRFRFNIKKWIAIVKQSYIFVLIGFFAGLYFKTDIYLLQFLKSEREVGIYSAGYKFFEALLFIVLSYNVSVTPIFRTLLKKGKKLLIQKMKKDIALLFILGMTVSLAAYFLFPAFLSLIVKKSYLPSGSVLQIVIFALPCILVSSVFSNALYVMKKAFLVIYVYIFQIVFNIGLNIIFIPRYSYIASSYITVISEMLNTFILCIIFYKVYRKTI
jgi:O-antigen/teichoic acid export membrane protein